MKAVICTRYGPPEVLTMMEVEKPCPNNSEVLIKVRATTVQIGFIIDISLSIKTPNIFLENI